MTLARKMVQAVRAYTMEQLSPESVAKVKIALLDMLSCAFEAQDLPWSQQAIAIASRARSIRRLESSIALLMPVAGRFLVTAVLVFDRKTVGELDPRGDEPEPAALDEIQTARFLTNLRRIAKRKDPPLAIATNEYSVIVPTE